MVKFNAFNFNLKVFAVDIVAESKHHPLQKFWPTDVQADVLVNNSCIELYIYIYKVVISICQSVCLSAHNSGTLGPICLKFRRGNLGEPREPWPTVQLWVPKLVYIYKVVISGCLFVFPIIAQEHNDRLAANFDWRTWKNHGDILILVWDLKLSLSKF